VNLQKPKAVAKMEREELPDFESTIDEKAIAFCIKEIWNKSSPQQLTAELHETTFFMLQLISLEDEAKDGEIRSYNWTELKKTYRIPNRL
jgi:hypothetical protein